MMPLRENVPRTLVGKDHRLCDLGGLLRPWAVAETEGLLE
jgi:hypothetical protein